MDNTTLNIKSVTNKDGQKSVVKITLMKYKKETKFEWMLMVTLHWDFGNGECSSYGGNYQKFLYDFSDFFGESDIPLCQQRSSKKEEKTIEEFLKKFKQNKKFCDYIEQDIHSYYENK